MRREIRFELLKGFYQSHGLTLSFFEVQTLQFKARQLQTIALKHCNGEMNRDTYSIKIERIEKDLKYMLMRSMHVVGIRVEGDPRGNILCLFMKNGDEIFPERFN